MAGTSSQENISTRQRKLVELARIEPKLELTTIAHHIDVVWLEEAWRRTRKDGAAGVDGVTASQYAAALEENLTRLLERFKTGRYRAPAVRRVHLPKPGTGKTRPIGIPTLEDKVLQRAVLMALEPIFEQDFLDCAYGFRPGRSAHQALERLWGGLMAMGGGWVIDLDIQNFFDDVDRDRLRNFLGQRVRDGVICRVIGKWLNAGVMESGQLHYPEQGTPQGGVISPLLANLYLHHVLDLWFEQTVKPRLQGSAFEVRFADDAVLVFEREEDARRVLAVPGKRLAKYGLRLHPDKTRLLDFRKPGRKGQSFQYLGFTHYWGRSGKGRWVVKRKTAQARLSRSLQAINHGCRMHRHWPVADQQAALSRKLKGHYAYYGIVGNSQSLARFLYEVRRRWYKWLSRRNRERMNRDHFGRLYKRYPLPPPRVVHGISRCVATP
ncbi:RNA-directed DNA polymerase [Methylomarinovum caldicuralii]|uniref:RNA-directed DNA polymerase n=2 Tax=Methylomarinovum caldicuralii TaxID=438856 RepID=A0AAU9CK34_9GAMM|nr:RNA-directed DNA polymerase [Methylomarinovum caldicuralii]BCX81998.1 RNA-directed DNA polymerase [Methylomarinovum caldicuralii]